MTDGEYQAGLQKMRSEWGSVAVDAKMPGILRADRDPTTGIMAGMRAALIAEIINRALHP